jgi:sterol desaturase/sphingolipid hydroxylase (fatty acid hydroxylase superfamily)
LLHLSSGTAVLAGLSHHLFTVDATIVLATWVSALVGALIAFLRSPYHGLAHTPRNFLRYLRPPDLRRQRSYRLDVWYLLASRLVHPLLITPVLLGNMVVAQWSYNGLVYLFGPHPQLSEGWAEWAVIVIATIFIADFFAFFCHYLEHKVGVLWELHKVHHSTLALLPISNRRIHPFQEIIDAGSIMLAVGAWIGAASFLFHLSISENLVLGVDAYFLANLLSFYHLRHSHIPLSYGWLERYLMSPAQHQLHHSVEVRHWDRNFGLLLSCYDRAFGTLVYSEPQGGWRLGLPGNEGSDYDTLVKLYFTPPLAIARRIGRWLGRPERGVHSPEPAPSALQPERTV